MLSHCIMQECYNALSAREEDVNDFCSSEALGKRPNESILAEHEGMRKREKVMLYLREGKVQQPNDFYQLLWS